MSDVSRRTFLQGLAVLSVLPSLATRATGNPVIPPVGQPGVEQRYFTADDWIPNNPRFPVTYMRISQVATADIATVSERLSQHGWQVQWQAAPFSFRHFHSTSHLLLTVIRGEGVMSIGGAQGKLQALTPGDVLILPAGTGQQLVSGSDDFQVLAAYPEEQCWDICRSAISATAVRRIASLSLPNHWPLVVALREI